MSTKSTREKKEYIILSIILLISLLARLYRIGYPLADWHSWRQADTSAVTRSFIKEGIDLLHPRYDDLSNIPSGKDNPEGWRFVEFPIVNAITASFFTSLPFLSLEAWGRLTSIIFSLWSIALLERIVSHFEGKRAGLIAAAIFGLLPFNIYFHRTILPEVPLLFFSLLALLAFIRWLETEKGRHFLISVMALALAFLLKPYVAFLVPTLIYLAYKKWGVSIHKKTWLYIYFLLALTPFLFWRLWASQFPEGIPAYTWLLNGSGIRWRPAFFRWIFAERLGKLILGYWGLIPFGLGMLRKTNQKSGWVFHFWLLGMLAYLVVFATGNVTHDYYQIFIIPPIAVFVAQGIMLLIEAPRKFSFPFITSYSLLITSLLFMFGFSWFHIRDFFNINHPEIVAAGQAADKILPPDAKVIAPYQGDTAFLYQTNRQGWPIGGEIKRKIELGATAYVTTTKDDESNYLIERCKPVVETDAVIIIDLLNCSL